MGWMGWEGLAVALINKIASIEGFFLSPFLYAKESQDGSKKYSRRK